jgi:hypothetical protein
MTFGPSVDYGQTIKNYRSKGRRDDDHRYEPPRDPFITKKVVFGAPKMGTATTAHAERNNGTMRHKIGRMRRLVYAFSKRLKHHRAAIALNYAWYNLGTIVKTIRMTPAMAAGVTDHIWTLDEFMEACLAETPAEKPKAQPLRHRRPGGTARELPEGRGFLRVVGQEASGSASTPNTPDPGPGGPVQPSHATVAAAPVDDRQLDLFAWRPKPRVPMQLNLFGEPDPTAPV